MRTPLDAIATLLDQGAADSAVRMLRSSWDPDLPPEDRVPRYCMWIRGLCETGDLKHALTLAERAAEEFPREPDVLCALGNVYDLYGHLEAARDAFALAVEMDPTGILQRYNLGAVLERLGDESEAERCYRQTIELDEGVPTLVEANAALGSLLRRQGRLDEAHDIYDAYLEEDPLDVEMLVEHGICLSDIERLDDAIDRFEVALSLDPEHPSAWYNYAITLYRGGRQVEAKRAMERAMRAEPSNPLALAVLGSWELTVPLVVDDTKNEALPEDEREPTTPDVDRAVSLLYRAVDALETQSRRGEVSPGFAGLVVEEVFEGLWRCRRQREAREIARMAGRRDWITPHMLETLNHADRGDRGSFATFKVMARVHTDQEIPEDWPTDSNGYETGLTVVAGDEDEARQLTLDYLRLLEPALKLQFEVEVSPASTLDAVDLAPRAPGVARVDATRSYIRARG